MDPIVEAVFASFLIPLISSLPLFVLDGRKADLFMLISLTFSTATSVLVSVLYVLAGMPRIHVVVSKTTMLGEVFGLLVDPMSVCIGFVVATAGYPFMLYSIEYMSPRNKQHPVYSGKGRFYGWMMLFIGATLAFVYSSTILQLLMFFELMSLSCWGVVSYYLTPESRRASIKALITTHIGALLGLFTAISYCMARGVSMSLRDLALLDPSAKLAVFAGVLIASLAKSAQFPFYSWLPDAMVAPTPASAFLHGAAMVEMGVYLLARIIQFMQPLPLASAVLLTIFVTLTLFLVAYMLIPQRDAKRLLAYSTIAESSMMYAGLIGAALGIPFGLQASMFLLFTHAYVKGLAFLTAGLFAFYIGTIDMSQIRGLLYKSKFTAFSWILALLGLAGIPPMPVFFGKLWIVISLAKALERLYYAWIPLVALILCSSVYFMVSLRWIHSMTLASNPRNPGINEHSKITLSPIFVLSMSMLIALAMVAPIIGYMLTSPLRGGF